MVKIKKMNTSLIKEKDYYKPIKHFGSQLFQVTENPNEWFEGSSKIKPKLKLIKTEIKRKAISPQPISH
jgi:hypothetical protein